MIPTTGRHRVDWKTERLNLFSESVNGIRAASVEVADQLDSCDFDDLSM